LTKANTGHHIPSGINCKTHRGHGEGRHVNGTPHTASNSRLDTQNWGFQCQFKWKVRNVRPVRKVILQKLALNGVPPNISLCGT